jgi:hypothetical protein
MEMNVSALICLCRTVGLSRLLLRLCYIFATATYEWLKVRLIFRFFMSKVKSINIVTFERDHGLGGVRQGKMKQKGSKAF